MSQIMLQPLLEFPADAHVFVLTNICMCIHTLKLIAMSCGSFTLQLFSEGKIVSLDLRARWQDVIYSMFLLT